MKCIFIGLLVFVCLNGRFMLPINGLCSSEQELNDAEYPYRYFSTKTLYDRVRGKLPALTERSPADCTPRHIFIQSSHGSRYPGTDAYKKLNILKELITKINTTGAATLCSGDIEKIRNWTVWYDPELDKDLAPTGYDEMQGLAERYNELFPELFSGAETKPDKYRFLSSDSQRTIVSVKTIRDEIIKADPNATKPSVIVNDLLLRFYDYCEKYIVAVEENDELYEDIDAFMDGPYIKQVIDALRERLGVTATNLSDTIAELMYKEGCANEIWARGAGADKSWCLSFETDDFKAYEYGSDMEGYIEKSYAYEISYKQSCFLKNYILSALNNATYEGTTSSGILAHFATTHSTAMAMIMTEMGFIKDEGFLTSDDYPNKADREFRTSLFTPGSSNLAFVLYNCTAGSPGFKLQVFLNEKEVLLPPTDDIGDRYWDFDEALKFYKFNDFDCNVQQMCSLDKPTGTTPMPTSNAIGMHNSSIIILVLLLLTFLLSRA